MTELKPCPFCGSSDIQQEYNGPHGYEPYVVCVDCGCCVDGKFGAWNTRAAIEAPVQEPVAWRWRLCYREEWCWSVSKPVFSTRDLEQGTVFDVQPVYTAPQPDETAALRAKLAEVAMDLAEVEALEMQHSEVIKRLTADRDEERKLADDLAMSLTEVSSRCGPLAEDGKRAKAVRARHAARRKEQQG